MKAKFIPLMLPLMATLAYAQTTPDLMSYQGRVTDASGALIGTSTPTNRLVTFRIYKEGSGGTAVYAETQTVTISGGEFSILIGNGTGLSGSPGSKAPGSPIITLGNAINTTVSDSMFLGITVDDGTAAVDTEISPRQQLVSGAYAMRAKVAESVKSLSITGAMIGNGQISSTQIAPSTIDSSRIATNGVAAGNIAAGAVTAAKLDSATIGVWTPTTNGTGVYRGSGNVGIGQTSPGVALSFGDGLGDKIALYGSNNPTKYGLGVQGGLFQIYTDSSAADVVFGYGTSASMTETMRVKGNGNVGIGTNAPGDKLVVNGGGMRISGTSNPYLAVSSSTGYEVDLAVALGAGNWSASAAANDVVLRSNSSKLILQSGSGAAAITIDTANKVGIGTASPTEKLTIQDGKLWFNTTTADTGGIGGTMAGNDFFRIYGYGGTDNSGGLYIDTYDDANEPIIFRQVAGAPSAPAAYYERMRIADNGNVCLGTSTVTGERLNVNGKVLLSYNNTTSDTATLEFDGNAFRVTVAGAGNGTRYMVYDGDSNIDFISDVRMKKDIVPAEDVLDRVLSINFKRFHMLDDAAADPLELGVIAQQVEPLFPELIGQITLPNGELRKSFGYTALGTLACKAVQELHGQLQEKDARISDLEARLDALEKLVSAAK